MGDGLVQLQDGNTLITGENMSRHQIDAWRFIKKNKKKLQNLEQELEKRYTTLQSLQKQWKPLKQQASVPATPEPSAPGSTPDTSPASPAPTNTLVTSPQVQEFETKMQEIKEQMKSLLTAFVGTEFFVAKTAVKGQKNEQDVVYRKDEDDVYRPIGVQDDFDKVFLPGLLWKIDKVLQDKQLNTEEILDGFKQEEADLLSDVKKPKEQKRRQKAFGIPAGTDFFPFFGEKLWKKHTGDETEATEATGRLEKPLLWAKKLWEKVFGTAEKHLAKDPTSQTHIWIAKSVFVWALGFLNGFVWSQAIQEYVDANGGGWGKEKRSWPREKKEWNTNNDFCNNPDRDEIYSAYCSWYNTMDTSTENTSRAAMKNNNPGNIKMPSDDGPLATALCKQGIFYEEGTAAGDGWHFMKFANVGDGYFALFALLGTQYKDYTLGYGLSQYSNRSYKLADMLAKLPTPPTVTGETTYKELTDDQFLALIDLKRNYEDGEMYALMEKKLSSEEVVAYWGEQSQNYEANIENWL